MRCNKQLNLIFFPKVPFRVLDFGKNLALTATQTDYIFLQQSKNIIVLLRSREIGKYDSLSRLEAGPTENVFLLSS